MDWKNFGALFLLFNISEIFGNPLLLEPNVQEIVVPRDGNLELNCTGQRNVTFIYKVDPDCLKQAEKHLQIYEHPCPKNKPNITYWFDGTNYFASLRRNNLVFRETGWYGCIETEKLIENSLDGLEWIGITPYSDKISDIQWIYVYVKSEMRSLVEKGSYIVYAQPGTDAFFSCTPTSPDIKPKFESVKWYENNHGHRNITHDPRRGFTLSNVTTDDKGTYVCYVSDDSGVVKEYAEYNLIVVRLSDSVINQQTISIKVISKPFIFGKTLSLVCYTYGSMDFHALRWKIPNKSNRVKIQYNPNRHFWLNNELTLIIENATSENEGEYECISISSTGINKNSAKINVTLVEESVGYIPKLSPNVSEIYLEEGDTLEIVCDCLAPTFIHPLNSKIVHTSLAEVFDKHPSNFRSVLKRSETIRGDSGWYGCVSGTKIQQDIIANKDTPIIFSHNDSDIKWIYVYVNSNTSHFVESLDTEEHFDLTDSEEFVIPCRPTSPKYKIQLFKDRQEVQLNDRLQFDPKEGFVLKNLTINDTGHYQCVSEGVNQELNFYIDTTRTDVQYFDSPYINYSGKRLVVHGELRITCSIEHNRYIDPVLNWTIPNQRSEIFSELERERLNHKVDKSVLELTIKNFTQIDEGEYICTITTISKQKSVSANITLNNALLEFRKLKEISIEEETTLHIETWKKLEPIILQHINPTDIAKFRQFFIGCYDTNYQID